MRETSKSLFKKVIRKQFNSNLDARNSYGTYFDLKAEGLRFFPFEELLFTTCYNIVRNSTNLFIRNLIRYTMEENFLESCRIDATQPSVTERYFKSNLISEFNQCVLTHSNRLCIVSLAPSHPILTQNLDVISVEFESVSLLNKVSGKSKRGGQKLNKRSILCSLKCSDGQNFSLHSCSPGKLVEINERLISNPNLIKEKPWTEGYVAIILPPFTSASKRKNNNT